MSADNWTTCPKCAVIREAELMALDIDIAEAYGSVDMQEFDLLRALRDERAGASILSSLREDYEFYGIDEGVLNVRYSAHCATCGFEHEFNHTDVLAVEAES